ncbi:hypothetical protein LBMAG53_38920 [Planctomycetota bacterium]|nr:hypothetical protein LBMAG53_38920 [Planctomycetota bacterium]
MSQAIGSLAVVLNLSTGAFTAGLTRATGQVQTFGAKLASIHGAASGLAGKLLAVVGIGGGFVGLAIGAQRAAERMDQLAKTADRLGVNTQSLAGLRHAADLAGVSSEQLEQAMGKLLVKTQEAATGNDQAAQAIARLGIPLNRLVAARPDEQMRLVAEGIGAMGTQAERSAALVEIFGKEGAKLMPLFAGGAAELAQAATEAQQFGLAISRVDAAKVEESNDALTRAGAVLEGIFNQIAVRVAPFITALSQGFSDAATASGGFGSTIDQVVNVAIEGAALIADGWWALRVAFQAGRVAVAAVGYGLAATADAGVRAAQWIGTKFQQAWDLVGATAGVLWSALKAGWAAAMIPVSTFVQYVSGQFAGLLESTSRALQYVDTDLANSLAASAGQIRASTGALGAEARRDMDAASRDLATSGTKVGAAFSALFGPVRTEGNDLITGLRTGFSDLLQQERAALNDLQREAGAGDRLRSAAASAQSGAQSRAEAKAKAVAAEQEQQDAVRAIQAQGVDDSAALERARIQALLDEQARLEALHQRMLERQAEERDGFLQMIEATAQANQDFAIARDASGVLAEQKWQEEHARKLLALESMQAQELISTQDAEDARAIIEQEAANHRIAMAEAETARKQQLMQTLVSGTSSMLGNLATLQQSHDKRMQAVGKAAAKAKIVVDTAQAAMASYQAMAGIPYVGPYLGALAAAAAIAAGAVQLANVDKGSIGGGGASTSLDASSAAGPASSKAPPSQTLLVQGDYLTPETLARIFAEARERGITIDGVRRA